MNYRGTLGRLIVVAVCLSLTTPVVGLAPAAGTAHPQEVDGNGHDLASPDLEAFVDGTMAAGMRDHHVPGAVVVVVRGEETLLAKGYGTADVDTDRPVVANETLFRVGSVSKLVGWTAVAQGIEAGRLDPDEDVDAYLPFEIPATYEDPVTLERLATHTAGFEEQAVGIYAASPGDRRPPAETYERALPDRVFPPGETLAYSNYGAGLAGYVAADSAGLTFEEYAERHVLDPLGMRRSSFRQPLPPALAADLAPSYRFVDGRYVAVEPSVVATPPAGALAATGTDVARFMGAHLNGGAYGDARILSPGSVARMQRTHWEPAPEANAMAFGFFEYDRRGVDAVGHGGAIDGYRTLLVLLPEHDVGLFVSTNAPGGVELNEGLYDAFVDRYFVDRYFVDRYFVDRDAGAGGGPSGGEGAGEPALGSDGGAGDDSALAGADGPTGRTVDRADVYAGTYRTTRTGYTDFQALMGLGRDYRVSVADDGSLRVSAFLGPTTRWTEVEPGVFRRVDAADVLVATTDESGRADYLYFPETSSVERLAWYETTRTHAFLLGGVLLAFLSTLLWPARWLRRRLLAVLSRASGGTDPSGVTDGGVAGVRARLREWIRASVPRLVAGATAIVSVGVLAGVAVVLADVDQILYGLTPLARTALTLPYLVVPLALASVAVAVRAWRRGRASIRRRVHYGLVALAALAFVWQLHYWRLLVVQ